MPNPNFPLWDGSSPTRHDTSVYRGPDGSDWNQFVEAYKHCHSYCDLCFDLIQSIGVNTDLQNQINDLQAQLEALRLRVSVGVNGVSDKLEFVDAVSFLKEKHQGIVDTLALVDTGSQNRTTSLGLSDQVQFADAIGHLRQVNQVLANVLTLIDIANQNRVMNASLASVLTLSDIANQNRTTGLTLTDHLALADIGNQNRITSPAVSSIMTLADLASQNRILPRTAISQIIARQLVEVNDTRTGGNHFKVAQVATGMQLNDTVSFVKV